jgi:hypothetical protein
MASENTVPKQHSLANGLYRFLGGIALGSLMMSIPISYGWPVDLPLTQIPLAALLPISGGLLSIF